MQGGPPSILHFDDSFRLCEVTEGKISILRVGVIKPPIIVQLCKLDTGIRAEYLLDCQFRQPEKLSHLFELAVFY